MNLLAYCYEYPPIGGGAGNALAHLARAWVRDGHRVTVVTSTHDELPLDGTDEGVRVIRLKVGRKSASRGRKLEMLRFMIGSWRTAEDIYTKDRPDLSVAFMPIPSGSGAWRLKQKHGLPMVAELRGGDVPGFLPNALDFWHQITKPLILGMWNSSSLVIANSAGLASLARRTAPHLDIRSLPNGVDLDIFSPGAPPRTGTGRCRFVFVGRLVDCQKKVSSVMRAIARVPNAELIVAGAGPDESRLRQLARQLAPDRIQFRGWLKQKDLIIVFRGSDVYVSASIWEGMSNSALEAMSCGMPLLLSRIGGHHELVEEGKSGFLFEPSSAHDLENFVRRMADDPSGRARMGSEGRQRAVDHFEWSIIARRHLELYREAVFINEDLNEHTGSPSHRF